MQKISAGRMPAVKVAIVAIRAAGSHLGHADQPAGGIIPACIHPQPGSRQPSHRPFTDDDRVAQPAPHLRESDRSISGKCSIAQVVGNLQVRLLRSKHPAVARRRQINQWNEWLSAFVFKKQRENRLVDV